MISFGCQSSRRQVCERDFSRKRIPLHDRYSGVFWLVHAGKFLFLFLFLCVVAVAGSDKGGWGVEGSGGREEAWIIV